MVTVEFKAKPTAMAAFRTLIDENAQMSREREPGHVACASPCSYPTIASCFAKSMIAARPSHLQSPHFAAFDRTSADWS
jgi:quinol monooxygenase YgiN